MLNLKNDTNTFYDALADQYHLFYRDWQAAIEREGSALRRIFRDRGVKTVLDTSCGTGTQAIGLAKLGLTVTAADPSPNMLSKAKDYARQYKVSDRITFAQADFLSLPGHFAGPFDAVITKGNCLPHLLTDGEIVQALHNFYDLLRPGGTLVIGMRDFDFLLEDRPRFIPRQLHTDDPARDEILFDVWDWDDGPPATVTFNTFIVSGKGNSYTARKYPVTYRALRRTELETMLADVGFVDVTADAQVWELVFVASRPK